MKKIILFIRTLLLGKPLNVTNPNIKKHISLIAVFAWIGLGADGLSSSSYGPEQSFIALGPHTHLSLYLILATMLTVFLISFSYNQVIELFPNGGGGYKVATYLLGSHAGVVSGSALIVDYILTITVSVVGGVDALASLLPPIYAQHKFGLEIAVIVMLIILNLRGMKESITFLFPLFLGFIITHVVIIGLGIIYYVLDLSPHMSQMAQMVPAVHGTNVVSNSIGLYATLAILLRAYSLGGGTYTGIEAVSNNVNVLVEPRVRTGKITMLYMAISLSLVAGGILLLYMLWTVTPVSGKTLNAVVFSKIIHHIGLNQVWVTVILFFEIGLLFVGANTGFLGCPTVISQMAVDKWFPRQFRELSNRLVTQNGILIAGLAAIGLLMITHGKIEILVVLYSINVFITFTLSLLGLSIYWIKIRHTRPLWWAKLMMSLVGLIICAGILFMTIIVKFSEGGWLTLLITLGITILCYIIRRHYHNIGQKLKQYDMQFIANPQYTTHPQLVNHNLLNTVDKKSKTAIFFVTKHYGLGLHTVLWVKRLFPDVFVNFVFITAGEIDIEAFYNEVIFKKSYRKDLYKVIEQYRLYCSQNNLLSDGLFSYGINEIDELDKLADAAQNMYPDCVFFASKLMPLYETLAGKLLHNNTVNALQRRLHIKGIQMVTLAMRIELT